MKRYQVLEAPGRGRSPAPQPRTRTRSIEQLKRFVTQEINTGETRNQREIEKALLEIVKRPPADPRIDLGVITPEQAQAFRERIGTALPRPSVRRPRWHCRDGRDGAPAEGCHDTLPPSTPRHRRVQGLEAPGRGSREGALEDLPRTPRSSAPNTSRATSTRRSRRRSSQDSTASAPSARL